MLERLIEHMLGHPGVVVQTCEAVVTDFRSRHPFASDSRFPFDRDYP
jgi:hypothetical protein